MSCMILNDDHINLLVTCASDLGLVWDSAKGEALVVAGNESTIARRLRAINIKAYDSRYGADAATKDSGKTIASIDYERVSVVAIMDGKIGDVVLQCITAAHCYEYQASNWGGYLGGPAYKLMRDLVFRLSDDSALRKTLAWEIIPGSLNHNDLVLLKGFEKAVPAW